MKAKLSNIYSPQSVQQITTNTGEAENSIIQTNGNNLSNLISDYDLEDFFDEESLSSDDSSGTEDFFASAEDVSTDYTKEAFAYFNAVNNQSLKTILAEKAKKAGKEKAITNLKTKSDTYELDTAVTKSGIDVRSKDFDVDTIMCLLKPHLPESMRQNCVTVLERNNTNERRYKEYKKLISNYLVKLSNPSPMPTIRVKMSNLEEQTKHELQDYFYSPEDEDKVQHYITEAITEQYPDRTVLKVHCSCGAQFEVPSPADIIHTGILFTKLYCPSLHPTIFKKSDLERLKELTSEYYTRDTSSSTSTSYSATKISCPNIILQELFGSTKCYEYEDYKLTIDIEVKKYLSRIKSSRTEYIMDLEPDLKIKAVCNYILKKYGLSEEYVKALIKTIIYNSNTFAQYSKSSQQIISFISKLSDIITRKDFNLLIALNYGNEDDILRTFSYVFGCTISKKDIFENSRVTGTIMNLSATKLQKLLETKLPSNGLPSNEILEEELKEWLSICARVPESISNYNDTLLRQIYPNIDKIVEEFIPHFTLLLCSPELGRMLPSQYNYMSTLKTQAYSLPENRDSKIKGSEYILSNMKLFMSKYNAFKNNNIKDLISLPEVPYDKLKEAMLNLRLEKFSNGAVLDYVINLFHIFDKKLTGHMCILAWLQDNRIEFAKELKANNVSLEDYITKMYNKEKDIPLSPIIKVAEHFRFKEYPITTLFVSSLYGYGRLSISENSDDIEEVYLEDLLHTYSNDDYVELCLKIEHQYGSPTLKVLLEEAELVPSNNQSSLHTLDDGTLVYGSDQQKIETLDDIRILSEKYPEDAELKIIITNWKAGE